MSFYESRIVRAVVLTGLLVTAIVFGITHVKLMLIVLGFLVVIVALTVRVITVQEATAVAFKYLGRFAYCAMQFTGHYFDPDGCIEEGIGPNSCGSCWCIWRIGGWVFYIRPLVQATKYSDQNDPDNFGEGVYVRLGDRTSEPIVSTQKTAAPENVGLKVQFVSTMRVRNPYRYLFVSPRDVKKQAVDRQDGVLRAWIRSGSQDHAQAARGNGKQLWGDLKTLGLTPVFDEIRDGWGLEILENSIVIKEVDYSDSSYEDALQARSKAALIAEADAAKIGAIDLRMDQWIKKEAKRLHKTVAEATVAAKADGSWDRQMRTYRDFILANGNNLNVDRIEVGAPDGTPLKGNLGDLAAIATIFGGRGGRGNSGGQGKRDGGSGGKKKKVENMSPAELTSAADRVIEKHKQGNP